MRESSARNWPTTCSTAGPFAHRDAALNGPADAGQICPRLERAADEIARPRKGELPDRHPEPAEGLREVGPADRLPPHDGHPEAAAEGLDPEGTEGVGGSAVGPGAVGADEGVVARRERSLRDARQNVSGRGLGGIARERFADEGLRTDLDPTAAGAALAELAVEDRQPRPDLHGAAPTQTSRWSTALAHRRREIRNT